MKNSKLSRLALPALAAIALMISPLLVSAQEAPPRGGSGRGGIPNATPNQMAALTAMEQALTNQTAAATAARTAFIAATFAEPKNDGDLRIKLDQLRNAKLALAHARADQFSRLQAGADKLNAEQVTALSAQAGRGGGGGRGGLGGGAGGRGGPAAPDDNSGFTSIFDGKTLTGWDGDPKFWRVEDGVIVAQSTPENRVTENTFLIWRGGKLKDFELKVDYRFTGNGNSGVQVRSRPSGPGRGGERPWGIAGYQFDMVTAGGTGSGVIYGEGAGGGFLYGQGTAMRRSADGTSKLIGTLGTGIADIIKGPGEWNTYHIIGRGNQITGFINGRACAIMIDDNGTSPSYALEGLLALQMHTGSPFRIDFRNIYLKNL
jgi:hypothetical protein